MTGFVDRPLLVLFAGLFVVNHPFPATGLVADAVRWLALRGVALDAPGPPLIGSIANLIATDLARRSGIEIDWKRHAAIGIPVTLLSLAVLAGTQALLR